MDLFEFQGKELFASYGVPVQQGKIATTPEEARDIAAEIIAAGKPGVVIKAQVKVGGRGKAGGVKLATSPEEARAKADAILGMDIKGHTVHSVLVAEDIAELERMGVARIFTPGAPMHEIVDWVRTSLGEQEAPASANP